jgi:predicted DNA-binding transcriptional regulator AlpA
MTSSIIETPYHFMSATDIGELLGVSRQRIDQIVKSDSTFPKPVAVLRGIRVWEFSEVKTWALISRNRPLVNHVEPTKNMTRFQVVIGHGPLVVILTKDLDERPTLSWARLSGRLEQADRFHEERVLVSLKEWNRHVNIDGTIRADSLD